MKGAGTWMVLCACLATLSACDSRRWPLGADFRLPPQSGSRAATPTAPEKSPRTAATASLGPAGRSPSDNAGDPILVGLNADQLRGMLGSPAEQEQEPPAEVWRYRYGRCTLDISLYPDVHTNTLHSLSYEVNGDDGTDQSKRQCTARLRSWAHR
ncbi:hypothetical protein [Ferrovibrio xuzhouensis]|uniref:Lipoprotein SmpA/OmlA domain-containing protein n=1 Tax=Ferrovibrio xuzhouensis TaxID=1576914 RepID=A0ABV7VAW5_9PROT